MSYKQKLEDQVRDGTLAPQGAQMLWRLHRDGQRRARASLVRLVLFIAIWATVVKVWLR